MTPLEKDLIEFARITLGILERDEEWDSGTMDDISSMAITLGLATAPGMFTCSEEVKALNK